jgi:hemerythrin superfamily protein
MVGTEAEAVKATTLLKNDHARVKGLFREYDDTGERAWKAKSRLFEKIKQELEIHSAIEEEIFYTAVREQKKKTTGMVGEAFQEHATVKRLLGELSRMRPQDDAFESKMSELMRDVKRHAKEEEDEMFPEAQKAFSPEELEDLGERLEERKRTLAGSIRVAPSYGMSPGSPPPRAPAKRPRARA